MSYLRKIALFNLLARGAGQAEGHDDLRAAAEVQSDKRKSRRGLFSLLWPSAIRAAAERRFAERMREEGLARLAETSPHLLDDVGIVPKATLDNTAVHNAHLADDIAIPPEDLMTVHTVPPDRPRAKGVAGSRRTMAE
jgi:hypothetical protein